MIKLWLTSVVRDELITLFVSQPVSALEAVSFNLSTACPLLVGAILAPDSKNIKSHEYHTIKDLVHVR